jgi:hypothetical protein
MGYIRINKLLRYTDLSIEELTGLLGGEEVLNPNTKLGIYREENESVDYNSLSTDELLSIRNSISRVLDNRLSSLHDEYISLKVKIEHPDLYSLAL